ncbi:retroviral-like aspartic protease family protein [Gemmata sp. JC717]|uniref:retroviral-like aspartic protease family protein n=1 Tax=Gemmata algarum TaxID=2975278 RepID=UPI0021BBAC90|nr:retroviral-like aspartic protease family protein [Gemmata algarum]MDY3553754.1 retroviral-like aspartic protease family protein [Gemmata algarum]
MSTGARFPYVSRGAQGPVSDLAPLLPLSLSRNGTSVDVVALVDSGATISVLPWSVGARFGVDWDALEVFCAVGGAAGRVPGKVILLDGTAGTFPPQKLVFTWVKSDAVPVIVGQANFFLAFDVFFFRTRGYFEIQPASAATP